jgi:hypothetical protein
MNDLISQVRKLVETAAAVYGGTEAEPELDALAARLHEPLRVAIAGRVKAGKSTLLNALVGQKLAATDAGECTSVISWYVDGIAYQVTMYPSAGVPRQLPFRQRDGALDLNLGGRSAADVDRLVITWPSPALRAMTLIDTPGMGSAHADVGARTRALLDPEHDHAPAVDAVIYLMRHVHREDARFLETFRDGAVDRRPVNTVAVLARADEIGHARPDALDRAERVAARYRQDPRLRGLCHTVLPVAGLLASAAAALTETDYQALVRLAAHPRAAWLLGGADRLCNPQDPDGPRDPVERAHLLDELGMFGLRLAVGLIQHHQAVGAGELSRALRHASGLPRLCELLDNQLLARTEVLKSRSALAALAVLLRRYPLPAASGLVREVERVQAGAHEFAEITLLDRLREGSVMFPAADQQRAERLLGADGMSPATRLGLPEEAGVAEISDLAGRELTHWQQRAESLVATRVVAQAARVLIRTCEGLFNTSATAPEGAPSPTWRTG